MLTTFDVGPDYVGGLHAAITHAQALLREKEEMSTMQLRLHAGRYPLGGRPLNISVDGIELVADSSEETIISGGLRLEWSNTDDRSSSLWTSPVPASGSPRQLWVGGRRAVPARHPNTGYLRWESALPGPFARWGLIYEADAQLKQWAGDEVIGKTGWSTGGYRRRHHPRNDPACWLELNMRLHDQIYEFNELF